MRNSFKFIITIFVLFFGIGCMKDEVIVKKDPLIIWSNPEDIHYGSLLSEIQLNATSDVAGTFVYTPTNGTVLDVGTNLDLNVEFTPDDLSVYNVVNKTVNINVITIPQSIQTVDIPAGTFIMGSTHTEKERQLNETQHTVTLSSYRMSKFEITRIQYAAFLNANNIGVDGIWPAASVYKTQMLIKSGYGLTFKDSRWIPDNGTENYPVDCVTWFGASEFATFVGGKLPTEAQWEYACRAGTSTPFNTGDFITNLQANYNWQYPYIDGKNTENFNHNPRQPVGKYPANAWGLHDMHGNIAEWCSDWFSDYPTTDQTDPLGPSSGSMRVIRGGSYDSSAQHCRSAYRYYSTPESYSSGKGFRVVFVP